jgi:transposase
MSQRKAARILQVSGQSVGRWVKKYVDSLPVPELPQPCTQQLVTELDELHTFVRSKKTNVI